MTAMLSFPSTEIGQHLEWYFDVRVRGSASAEEVDAHFAPEYRWGWGSPREPAALQIWFDRWKDLRARIEGLEELEDGRYVVTTRLDNGVVARVWFEMEDTAPYRIRRTATTESEPSQAAVDFGEATAVTAVAGGWQTQVPPAFTTAVGPFGGYVAALAVASPRDATGKSLPISMSGHFLNAGRAGPVEVAVSSLRTSSRLESMRVQLSQGDVPIFEALVWGAEAGDVQGHALRPLPDVPSPHEALSGESAAELFAGSMEAVPVSVAGDPSAWAAWVRLAPRPLFDNAWVDAARLLLPIDWVGVGATGRARAEDGDFVIPSTIDVAVSFFNHQHASDWVLCQAESPVAAGGVATATSTVWSEDGHVLAMALVHVLQRGRPRT